MLLGERVASLGRRLFRFRSVLPLAMVPIVILAWGEGQIPFSSDRASDLYEIACLVLSAGGLLVRVLATAYAASGSSGRQRDKLWAGRLNTSGIYSIVRNPLYLANLTCWTGVALATGSPVAAAALVLFFLAVYIPIIMAEEEYLAGRFGEEFLPWVRRTPCLVPRRTLWRSPEGRFNWKRVLKKEPDSAMSVISAFAAVGIYRDSLAAGAIVVEREWIGLGAGAVLVWLVLRILKKRTDLFLEPKWKAPGTELDLQAPASRLPPALRRPDTDAVAVAGSGSGSAALAVDEATGRSRAP